MKHIVHVSFANDLGGGEFQTLNLIKALTQHSVKQSIVLKKNKKLESMIDDLGLCIEKIYVKSLFSSLFHKSLRGKNTIIHAHDGRGVHWAAFCYRLWKTPYVITRRVENAISSSFMAGFTYKNASALIGISQAIENTLKRYFPHNYILKISDSYSSFICEKDTVEMLSEHYKNKFIVGQVGSLISIKGHIETIKAAEILGSLYPDIEFVILGDGEDRIMLEERSKGLSNLSFLGHKSNVGDYLSIFDLLIHPSRREGLGSIILEAQEYSVPVIGTNVGGIPDIIKHGDNGLLIDAGNVQQLVDAIVCLYENKVLRDKFSAKALELLSNFNIDIITSQYLEVYENIGNR